MWKTSLKLAWKSLANHKFFAVASLFGISLTLTVLILAGSFFQNTLGRKAPETRYNRTLAVVMGSLENSQTGASTVGPIFSYYFLDNYVKSLETPQAISIGSFHHPTVQYHEGRRLEVDIKYVDGAFWQIMDFEFLQGRPFSDQQSHQQDAVAVISQETAQGYFGVQNALDQTIQVGGQSYRIIGVVKDVPLLRIIPYGQVWVPITWLPQDLNEPSLTGLFPGLFALVLAESPGDLPTIQEEYRRGIAGLQDPENRYDRINAPLDSYFESVASNLFRMDRHNSRMLRMVFLLLALLFMALPAVNLANLNLSRLSERSEEIALRKTFGAQRRHILLQLLAENIYLTLLGGLISLALSQIILWIVNSMELIPHMRFTMNLSVLLLGLLWSLIFGLLSGLAPAWKLSKLAPAEIIRGEEL